MKVFPAVKKAWLDLEHAAVAYTKDPAFQPPARAKLQAAAIAYARALEEVGTLAAAELGRKGGAATSSAKAEAARANGARGGRPRKGGDR